MPAYQSAPDFSLTEKYHMKAVGCEQQWHSIADQAATMSGEASPADFAG
jgi:hypothetical protein